MTGRAPGAVLERRALKVEQRPGCPLYVFSLTAAEILQIADISRVRRDDGGDLIGYQRPEVRQHINEIAEYVDSEQVIFPNPIIIALPSTVRFTSSRGPNASDGAASGGMLSIPVPSNGGPKPGWIVDGQQRTLALARARRQDLPVIVNAFVADTVDVQRDQFVRINNTRPLPRGLVNELLPSITTPLPPRLAIRQAPSALCDLLNNDDASPFKGLIRRTSMSPEVRRTAVVVDTSVVEMLRESLTSPSGCLFPFRNMATGDTDYLGLWQVLVVYWAAVRDVFAEAWGRPASESRLTHGAGIRSMGRVMDRVMATVDAGSEAAPAQVREDLELLAPHCRWTEGVWDELNLRWDEVQNVGRHINALSNHLVRAYVHGKAAQQ